MIPTRAVRTRTSTRDQGLRRILRDRQAALHADVRGRMDVLRAAGGPGVHQMDDDAETDVQQDIELTMIQIHDEMSRRIDAALQRIEAGDYGDCASCARAIPTKRLQALPFAIRCLECERAREHEARARTLTRDRETAVGAPEARL